jgi:integrase
MPLVNLTQTLVDRKIGEGDPIELVDDRRNGLSLRIRATDWTWCFRRTINGKDLRRDLGKQWTLKEARDLVIALANDAQASSHVISDPTSFARWMSRHIDAKAGLPRVIEVADPVPAQPLLPASSKTFLQASEAWIAHVEDTRKPKTAIGYAGNLNIKEVRTLHERIACTITVEEVEEVIEAIHARKAQRQAQLTLVCIRRLYGWMSSTTRLRKLYGITGNPMAVIRQLERSRAGTYRKIGVPTGPEIGKIVHWLMSTRDYPERDLLAALMLVYTCQRRESVVSTRRIDDMHEVAGYAVWAIPPAHRKTVEEAARRGIPVGVHAIPLPPSAWAHVENAKDLAGDSDWLFPAERARREGAEATHMHADTITHLFHKMTYTIDDDDNDDGKEIPIGVKPHDIRRAFGTTFGQYAELDNEEIQRILDHRVGTVTTKHYSFLPQVKKKFPTMLGWCEWVDKWYATEKAQAEVADRERAKRKAAKEVAKFAKDAE